MRIIGLCGYFSTGKEAIAGFLSPEFKRVALLDAAKKDLGPLLKRWVSLEKSPDKPTAEDQFRDLLLEYRRTAIRLSGSPSYWISRLPNIMSGAVVVTDVYDVPDARWVLEQGGKLFRIHRQGGLPCCAEEAQAAQRIHTSFNMPQIEHFSRPEMAAQKIREEISRQRLAS